MFPYLHHHVSKVLLVCPDFAEPARQSLRVSNLAPSDEAGATRSHSDRSAIVLKVVAMQGEIQDLLPIGSKTHDRVLASHL